jgi:hypothetical protein
MFIQTTAWIVCSTIETTNQQKKPKLYTCSTPQIASFIKKLKKTAKITPLLNPANHTIFGW